MRSSNPRRLAFKAALGLWLFAAFGCHCSKETSDNVVKDQTPEEQMRARGKVVYQANCIACHNVNPKLPGSLGPDVAGSSRALLEARVLKGTYPEGYKPKRASKAMSALPHLVNDIDSLTAYLNVP